MSNYLYSKPVFFKIISKSIVLFIMPEANCAFPECGARHHVGVGIFKLLTRKLIIATLEKIDGSNT